MVDYVSGSLPVTTGILQLAAPPALPLGPNPGRGGGISQ